MYALVGRSDSMAANRSGIDSGDLTPSSSAPGTPAFGHTTNLGGLGLSGVRASSRQSDGQELLSVGSTAVGSSNAATDHVVDRHACTSS